ncbi:MAG: CPBP family intramembrane glutamic endopeptidase [Flavobacteriales bacterium]
MKSWVGRYPVLTLVMLVLGTQLGIVLTAAALMPPGVRMHDAEDAHTIFRLRVFGPLVFAIAISWYLEGKAGLMRLFRSYKVWRVPGRWYGFAISWKFLFCYLAWAIADLAGIMPWPGAVVEGSFTGSNGLLSGLLASSPFIIGIAVVEETTWMKFCLTRLQDRYSAFVSCLLTGVAWGLWYLPMLLLGEGVPDGVPWYMFLLSMVGLALILGWVYNMTRSGLILLFMQLVSNIAFFVMPALPGWHDGNPQYVVGFIVAEVFIAAVLVLVYGPKELGIGPRPTWSDGLKTQEQPKVIVPER